MIKISVEFLSDPSKRPVSRTLTRVPCIGEYVVIGSICHEVREVMHFDISRIDEVAATVRVKTI